MRKYSCEKGEFKCRYCGTVYPYSDLRDMCEGRPYYKEWREHPNPVLDELRAEVGEKVLVTIYVGDTWAQPPKKAGLHLLYSWEEVREKRIIPLKEAIFSIYDKTEHPFPHFTEYRIGPKSEVLDDDWDVTKGPCGLTVGCAIGPRHVWSKDLVENALHEKWPNYIVERCFGENTKEVRQELKNQGFDVYV